MEKLKITLTPYTHFEGNCEEALNFYAEILNGTVEIIQRYDAPAMRAPKEYQHKVLHGVLSFAGNAIFASDVFPGSKSVVKGGNTALSLGVPDSEAGQRIFSKLAEGVIIGVPFEKQFWGAWHGNLTDRFGIKWMVNV